MSAPMKCINCDGKDIESFDYDGDGHFLWCKTRCADCNSSWTEYYRFSSWEAN